MPVAVLTYHSQNICGNTYQTNDHIAFAADLRTLNDAGWEFVSALDVAKHVVHGAALPQKAVAITMDDGCNFDYFDLPYLDFGVQRSMLNIMRDFKVAHSHTRTLAHERTAAPTCHIVRHCVAYGTPTN